MLNHVLEFKSQGDTIAFLVSRGMTGAVVFVVLKKNFGSSERTEANNSSSGIDDVGWITLVGAVDRGRNGKF